MDLNIIIKKKYFSLAIIKPIILILYSLITIVPFIAIIVISLRESRDFLLYPIGFPKTLNFKNYYEVIKNGKVLLGYLNSIKILISVQLVVITLSSMASYGLTKMQFKNAKFFSRAFLVPMVFPVYTTIIPLYIAFSKLHLTNIYGFILISIAMQLPLAIFILTSFMNSISYQLSESAFIEGASHSKILLKIILPLIRPAIATTIILTSLPVWNDFYLSLIMLGNLNERTLPLTVFDYSRLTNTDYTKVTACIVFMVLPVITIYIFLQKHFIRGITEGAIKG